MYEVLNPDIAGAELARRHHVDYIDFMWPRQDPFLIGQHTEFMGEKFDDAVEKYKKGVSSYITLKIPVRHGKSDIASRYFPSNFIGKFPDQEVIVAAYSYQLSRTFSRFCRDNIMMSPKYQLVYPGVSLSKKNRSTDSWGIEGNFGQVHWVGLGGSVTGRGGSCILIDDFFKGRKEAESEVIRDAVWEAVSNDIFTRRAPVCIVIILATPWHIDDVFGRIEKKQKENPEFPQFEDIKFPAFDEKYKGGILFPERFSLQWYQAERAMLGPYATAGLLQCEPTARGGNQFEVDKIKKYDIPPDDVKWCRGWDLASSEVERIGEDPDYTVGSKVGVRWVTIGDGKSIPEIYVDDVNEGRWAAPKRNEIIVGTTISDGPSTQVAIESFGPYKDAYLEIKKALHGVRVVKKLQLPGDKTSKASVLEAPIAAGNFHIRRAPWNDRFLAQFRAFPGGAHDDIVDSVVVGFEGHDPYERRVWPQIQKKHIVDLNINWEKTRADTSGSLHFAGMWQKEDLSVWVVQILWDSYTGYLFIYDSFMCEQPTPNQVVPELIEKMKLKEYKCESIVCNSLMWESKGYSKNVALQYRNNFNKRNLPVRVKEAINYDEYGSIVEVGQIFDTDMARIDVKIHSFILQVCSWTTVDRGRQSGYRPDTEDDGFCRALCLVVSELKRRERYVKIMEPKFYDYNKEPVVRDMYNKVQQSGNRRTASEGVVG